MNDQTVTSGAGPAASAEVPKTFRVSSLDEVAEMARHTGAVFLGFLDGSLPAGRAREEQTGVVQVGLPAWQVLPEPWWTDSEVAWIARQLAENFPDPTEDRLPYLVTGRVVGRDPNGTLLLAGTRPVAEITMAALAEAETTHSSREGS